MNYDLKQLLQMSLEQRLKIMEEAICHTDDAQHSLPAASSDAGAAEIEVHI